MENSNGNGLDLEKEIKAVLVAPLYLSGDRIPEEEGSIHHFITMFIKSLKDSALNSGKSTIENKNFLLEIDDNLTIEITKIMHDALNRLFKNRSLPFEIIDRVDSLFSGRWKGNNKKRTRRKLDLLALCVYSYKYARINGLKKKKVSANIIKREIEVDFEAKRLLDIFGIKKDDIKLFLEHYFVYPDWKKFNWQWKLIFYERDRERNIN